MSFRSAKESVAETSFIWYLRVNELTECISTSKMAVSPSFESQSEWALRLGKDGTNACFLVLVLFRSANTAVQARFWAWVKAANGSRVYERTSVDCWSKILPKGTQFWAKFLPENIVQATSSVSVSVDKKLCIVCELAVIRTKYQGRYAYE